MKSFKFTSSAIISLWLITTITASAAVVQVDPAVVLQLTIGGVVENFIMEGGNLTDFSVGDSSFGVVTSANEVVTILGPTYISFGANTLCDTSTKSKIIVPASTTMTITPLRPATTDAEYKNTCDGRTGGGGGGGGGGSGGGVGGSVSSPPTKPSQSSKPDASSSGSGKSKIKFLDVPGTGKKKLSAASARAILNVAEVMVDQSVYVPPSKFLPLNKITAEFAIRIALAIYGKSCGTTATAESCRAQAEDAGLVKEKEFKKKYVTRAEYYTLLLRAGKVPLLAAKDITSSRLCKDVAKSSEFAPVVATARYYKIAKLYTGRKCLATLNLQRFEAMRFAEKAMKVRDKLKKASE